MSSHERERYAVVGTAMRDALARAREVRPRLKAADRAVLDAVLVLTASYSKLADNVYAAQIAALAGVHEVTARTSLKKLAAAGVIEWEPRKDRRKSRLALPHTESQWLRCRAGSQRCNTE